MPSAMRAVVYGKVVHLMLQTTNGNDPGGVCRLSQTPVDAKATPALSNQSRRRLAPRLQEAAPGQI
jgi:hypothetical protein